MRYDLPGNRLTQLAAYLNLYPAPWINVSAGYDNLTLDGPERFRRGVDALVGAPLSAELVQAEQAKDPDNLGLKRAQQLGAGFGIRLGFGLGIRYGALMKPVQFDAAKRPRWSLEQQTAAISYSPSCDCWRVEVGVRLGRVGAGGFPTTDFTFQLVVYRFGSFGIGG
jgi:LPS-assembly protein